MSPLRTINHPDVEIREIDKSQVAPALVGTSVYVAGFSNKGVKYEPIDVVSVQDLETNFGKPTNEAERYFYYACREVLNEGGNLVAARLPYNNTADTNYKLVGISLDTSPTLKTTDLSAQVADLGITTAAYGTTIYAALTGLVSAAEVFNAVSGFCKVTTAVTNITDANYDLVVAGNCPAALDSYHFVIVNENKAKLAGVNNDEGIFVSLIDPFKGLIAQRLISVSDSDPMIVKTGLTGSTSTFVNNLTATFVGNSISEELMNYFPSIEFASNGANLDTYRFNHLAVVVSRTTEDSSNEGHLLVSHLEAFVGSLDSTAKDPSTGESIYLGDLINTQSNYIKFYKTNTPVTLSGAFLLYKAPETIDLLAFTTADSAAAINGANIISDLDKCYEKVSNINERQIDIVVDAGLSTIAEYADSTTSYTFDPTSGTNTIVDENSTTNWRNVCTSIDNFCKNIRKDCMAIVDAPRQLVIEADVKIIRKTAPTQTFSNTIGPKLKYITGLNSSYMALYSDWMRMVDSFTAKNFWMPPSCKAVGIYVRTDRTANIWDAPAGLNRGILYGINDLAFNPKDKEADQLYMKSFNYAKQYPFEGFVLEGQKTTQVKPSAFDRVNVRRLFLRLERYVYQVSRYFVYEPNNLFTRRRLVATINPLFQEIKAAGGMYDYRIVCDETNNTAEVIDHNELRVAILIKPVRTAEFILVDFIATRTDANFSELL